MPLNRIRHLNIRKLNVMPDILSSLRRHILFIRLHTRQKDVCGFVELFEEAYDAFGLLGFEVGADFQ